MVYLGWSVRVDLNGRLMDFGTSYSLEITEITSLREFISVKVVVKVIYLCFCTINWTVPLI